MSTEIAETKSLTRVVVARAVGPGSTAITLPPDVLRALGVVAGMSVVLRQDQTTPGRFTIERMD